MTLKKPYEKPTAEVTSFQLNEELTITGSTGTGIPPWQQQVFDAGEDDYQLNP